MLNLIPIGMWAVSSFYYLFGARCLVSKLIALYSFLLSSAYLFWLNHGHLGLEIAILLVVAIAGCFFLSYLFISDDINMDQSLDRLFITLLTSRFFMSREIFTWEISLVLELLILLVLNYRADQQDLKHRKGVFFSLILLFLLSCLYSIAIGVLHAMNIVVVAVLAAAGAGAIQFLCFSKTQREQNVSLVLYLFSNLILDFMLRQQGESVPQVSIWFLSAIRGF